MRPRGGRARGRIVAYGSCASWAGAVGLTQPDGGGRRAAVPDPTRPWSRSPVVRPTRPIHPGTVLFFRHLRASPPIMRRVGRSGPMAVLIHENLRSASVLRRRALPPSLATRGTARAIACKLGCRGPETNNRPSLRFNNNIGGGVWLIGVGHPCFGCSEQGTGPRHRSVCRT